MDDRVMDAEGDAGGVDTRDAGVEDLFVGYRDGFDDFDGEAIADCFLYPATIWQFGRGNVFADRDELMENVEALLGVLEREEVVRSDFEIVDIVVEGACAFAVLDWRQEREDGEEALSFRCHYTLLLTEADDWRIVTVVND
jgi:hypothetical protein